MFAKTKIIDDIVITISYILNNIFCLQNGLYFISFDIAMITKASNNCTLPIDFHAVLIVS